MNTNGRLAGQNGHSVRQNLAAATLTTGVSVRMPQDVRNGVVFYGQVRSSDGKRWYTVKKVQLGIHRFSYACTCLGNFLGGHSPCRHIAALKLTEAG